MELTAFGSSIVFNHREHRGERFKYSRHGHDISYPYTNEKGNDDPWVFVFNHREHREERLKDSWPAAIRVLAMNVPVKSDTRQGFALDYTPNPLMG